MFRPQKIRFHFTVFLALAIFFPGMNLVAAGSFGSLPAFADDSDMLLLSIPPMIAARARKDLRVVSPGAGETMTAGSWYTIRWLGARQAQKVDILLSTDGGASYPITVAAGVPNSLHKYTWYPVPFFNPSKLSSTCKIKIRDTDNPLSIFGVSNGFFGLAPGAMTLGTLEIINTFLESNPEGIEKDSDGDGLYDNLEIYLGTDPTDVDTDHDGFWDNYEVFGDAFNIDDPVPNVDSDNKIAALDTDDNGDGVNDGRSLDSDGDGIANYLEVYGYVYGQGGMYLYNLWQGNLSDTYFKSDPLQASTDGDHYSDGMEASGVNMDRTVMPPGNHPAIAAFPNIQVRLMDYEVTLNAEITESNGTVHQIGRNWSTETSTSSASTEEAHWDVSASVDCGLLGCNGGVSATVGGSYSQTLTNGVARSNGGDVMDGSEWSLATCTNATEAAKVKLNLEATNIGSCAAANVGFVMNLYIGTDLVYTYDNRTNPISFMAVGDHTSWMAGSFQDIYLTFNELRLLENGAPIVIKVSNVTAEVLRKKSDGTWEDVGDWNPYMNEIENISAHLYLDLGNGETTEHLVYADDALTAPVVTVRDALRWVANAQEDPVEGPLVRFFQTDGSMGDPAPLDDWYFSLDPTTFAGIAPYLRDPEFQFFDTVLQPGTTLIAKAPPAQPTPAIRWGMLSPRHGAVKSYVDDYFFNNPAKIDVYFVDKYNVYHTMNWNGANYQCPCPTNNDGSVYFKDGTEKIIAQNAMYGNPDDPNSANYHTELPAASMRYLSSFDYPYPLSWLDTERVEHAVATSGNYAYVAADGSSSPGINSALLAVDISNPLAPAVVDSVDIPGNPAGVFVNGTRAYVSAQEEGLRIIDISDPANLTETGYFDTAGWAVETVVVGNYAYVADGEDGLRIINVTNPAHPTEAGSFDTPGNATGVFVAGGYAYIADGGSGLRIINVSNPASPTEVGFFNTIDPDHLEFQIDYQSVFVSGGLAYMASALYGLQIINVSNPASPTFYSGYSPYDLQSFYLRVTINDSYAFISDLWKGLRVIDISDPLHPAEVGAWLGASMAFGFKVNGNYAYLATYYSGLVPIDISNPADPRMPSAWAGPGEGNDVFVDGEYAYIAGGYSGLQVVNIHDPATPALTGSFDTPDNSESVFVKDGYAYVADGNSGLRVIDVSNPASPAETGSYDTPGSAKGVFVSGDYAYVADDNTGLQVIDVSNPATPFHTGDLDTNQAVNVFVAGDYAFLADGYYGLKMIDVSNPYVPALVGYYETVGYASDVSVAGGFAYVSVNGAGGYGGLLAINISSPGTPGAAVALPKVGQFEYGQPGVNGLFLSGDYAFLALGPVGFQIIDVSDPTAPSAIGLVDTPENAKNIFAVDDRVYVASGPLELYVARFK